MYIRTRIVTGNTIVLEHLPGVFSLYYHLSDVLVQENEIVEEAQIIGKAGASGLATGPHLHWEIRVSGVATDPEVFIRQKIIDYEEYFRIIKATDDTAIERR